MNDMTPAGIGHNNSPDPIDAICAAYEEARTESENWLDGGKVETEGQMKAVDALRKSMRECRLSLEAGQKSATAPLHDVYKAELARWKPTIEDTKRIEGCLVAAVDTFKRKLAEEKPAAEKAAWEETNRLRREAEEKARQADASNLEAQREVEAARHAAMEAEKAAKVAAKDQPKGMRTVTRYEIEDHKAALHWIAANDRAAMTAFIDEYVRRNHKSATIGGVRVYTEKEAY
ncbi:MAG: hypothetical protein II336_18025 [Loktanella sp.]|nr:hypothetical protein [Loktanella sp.]